MKLTDKDIAFIVATGRRVEDVLRQIETIKCGPKYLKLIEPATIKNGRIQQIDSKDRGLFLKLWKDDVQHNIVKFVPASGMASRMFKEQSMVFDDGLDSITKVRSKDFAKFWELLPTFPFYTELSRLLRINGIDIEDERRKGKVRNILRYLLTNDGLGYSKKPKLLMLFSMDDVSARLAMEEHVKEAVWTAGGNVHFTISQDFLREASDVARKITGYNINISFSTQDHSTDVIAMTPDRKKLFRDRNGNLFFRQCGHGALIKNLSERKERYIQLQNVDNLVGGSEGLLDAKRVFMGYYRSLERKLFEHVRSLKKRSSKYVMRTVRDFAEKELSIEIPDHYDENEMSDLLNRPLVLVSVVKRLGELGGEPFAVFNKNNNCVWHEIVESSQQNINDRDQKTIIKSSTHCSPTFMMLSTCNAWGDRFDLTKYAQKGEGYSFFVKKHDQLGRPFVSVDVGLWNGEMADMLKVFAEMPIEIFCPAKTVLDLSPEIRKSRKHPYPEIVK